jgi:hypothetical protein|tara:strand:- start:463 stop:1116 length:654 start_codon:yes stop_codon:yes gene_type:complete
MMVMDDIESTYNAWVTYQALNAHFTRTRDYDYFKYNGKGTWSSIESMEKSFIKYEQNGNFSLQRKIFKDIGNTFTNKEALIYFYLSQFTNGIEYPSHFETDLYDEYIERMNNFDFTIKKDTMEIKRYLDKFEADFDDIFKVVGINHPTILKMGLSNAISLETIAVLDMILGFTENIDRALNDPLWNDYSRLIKKYKPFLEVDIVKQKKIIMDVLTKG